MNDRTVFAYWHGEPQGLLEPLRQDWTSAFPDFHVYGDAEVRPLLAELFPEHLDLYEAIRIPAARSDIARLLILYDRGGLYVDCHVGMKDANAVRSLLADLDRRELILVDRANSSSTIGQPPTFKKGASGGRISLMNGVMFARARSSLLLELCRRGLENLARQRAPERDGAAGYHIGALTGPRLLSGMLLDPDSGDRHLRKAFEGRIGILEEVDAPIARNRWRTYGGEGQHWLERQQLEPLFSPPA